MYEYSAKRENIVSHPFQTGMKPILVVVESTHYEKIVGASKETFDSIWFTEANHQFFKYMKSKLQSNHKIRDVFLVGVYSLT